MSELEGAVPATAGQLLRGAREAAGMHVAALAVALKVPVSKLEALEADRLEVFPDAVFVRALASSVCRTLRLDPAPVLERLPQSPVPKLGVDEGGLNAPFRTPQARRALAWPAFLSQPMLLAVPLLCVGALAIYLWPQFSQPDEAPVTESATVLESPAAREPAPAEAERPAAEPNPAVAAAPAAAPAPVAGSAPAVVPPPMAAVAAKMAEPTPRADAALVAAEPAKDAPKDPGKDIAKAGADAGAGVAAQVAFSATGASWIKVTDAHGAVVLQKMLASGESASASGAAPLSVVVGKVDVTQVQVRGKSFDLAGVARENVARFEVK